jgi:LPS export ABC transporter protein LptC
MIHFFRHIKIIVFLSFSFGLIVACENDIKVVQDLGKSKQGVEEGKNILTYWSTGGKVKAKLTSPLMYRYLNDSPRVVFPHTVHVDFFDSALHVQSQLFAKYGQYIESQNKVFLRDSVIAFNVKKDTLWCDELYWDQNLGTFYTDKPVRIHQINPMQKIRGIGMTADQNLKWFTIKKASGPVVVPDSVL